MLFTAARLSAQAAPAMPDSVRRYVHDAMAAFRSHSVHQSEIDWPSLEDSVLVRSTNARTPADTWQALTWALRSVDRHSYLLPPADRMPTLFHGMIPAKTTSPQPVSKAASLLEGDVGVVVVKAHTGINRPAYVDSLLTDLATLDRSGACGWVVDLRDDTGGNMWPMLAGVGPLLGAEVVGSFSKEALGRGWHYRDGRSWDGDSIPPAAPPGSGSAPPPRLAHADAPVALLIGNNTASSGEMVLLAFLGRPDVRSFGDSTAGYTSGNSNVALPDGATMIITSSYPRDRMGRTYPLRIAPDELLPASDSGAGDAPLNRAVAWLHRQARVVMCGAAGRSMQ
ncbi:MAG: S41 family peptidase [Gemmatimonadota bacterium]|nr:S41 family peptidase [Gemmatimonadota bacterium]